MLRADEKDLIATTSLNKDLTLPDRIPERLRTLAERGVRILLAFSQNDEGLGYFREQYGKSFEKLREVPGVAVERVVDGRSRAVSRRLGHRSLDGDHLPLGDRVRACDAAKRGTVRPACLAAIRRARFASRVCRLRPLVREISMREPAGSRFPRCVRHLLGYELSRTRWGEL